MNSQTESKHLERTVMPPQGESNRNKRILHVKVPEDVFNAAKAKSLLDGIPWPLFVIGLLKSADPRKPPATTDVNAGRDSLPNALSSQSS